MSDRWVVFGWLATICFTICAVPEAISAVTVGSSGVPWSMLLLWGLGEIFAIVYITPKKDWPLLVNYVFNLICILTIIIWGKL